MDVVQRNAPEYDSDTDRQTDLLPDIQPSMASHTACTAEASSHAENIEEDTAPVTANSEEHQASSQDSYRLKPQSEPVPDNTDHSVYQDTEPSREESKQLQTPIRRYSWEEGHFADADFIDHHNTTEEK